MKTATVTTPELITDTVWDGAVTTVTITDIRTGARAKAIARLHPEDEYNFHIGYDLAATRAFARLYEKIARKESNRAKQIAKNPKEYSRGWDWA